MYWATRLALVWLAVTQVRCGNDGYGFVKWEIVTQCIANPINDVCPLGHEVPKRVYNNYPGIRSSVRRSVAKFRLAGGNDNCTEAVTMFQCSQWIKTCKSNLTYFYLDTSQAHALCVAARHACAGVDRKMRETWLNCDAVKKKSEWRQTRRQASCRKYPVLENDKCPKRNYKVVRASALRPSFLQDQNKLQLLLRRNNVGVKCSNDVFNAFCDYSAAACTKDEQFEVSLLSEQKCLKILSCLKNATTNAGLFSKINSWYYVPCEYLPDERTAKKISVATIYNLSTHVLTESKAQTISPSATYNPSPHTPIESSKEKMAACCSKGSRMSALAHMLIVFIFWFLLDNLC